MNNYIIAKENILNEIINHYKNPKHKKIIPSWTYKTEAERPMCGDNITIYIYCNNGIIQDASFDGIGCSIAQGCSDIMCDRIIGLNKNELSELNFDLFNLDEVPFSKSRIKCATLSFEAIKNIKKD